VYVSGATNTGVPKYLDGIVSFDKCKLSGTVTMGEPGVASQNFAAVTGTYDVQADGTIALSFLLPGVAAPETYVVGYSQIFGEALGEETDSSAIATIDLKPQSFPVRLTATSYNNASLSGTFTASCSSGGGGFSDLNWFTFDGTSNAENGAGNISGVDDSNNNAQFYDEPYIGSYAVLPDGNFGGAVTVAGQTYGFTGIIDNNGNEIQYVFTQPGNPVAFVGCTGKRVVRATPQVKQ
jgi:hypothetical protein